MTGHEVVCCTVLFDVQLLQQSGSGPNAGALSNLGNLGLGESCQLDTVIVLQDESHGLHFTCITSMSSM